MNRRVILAKAGLMAGLLSGAASLCAQGGGASEKDVSDANNPLANMNALNFQNYHLPTIYGITRVESDVLDLRA